jgi:hypothetical protein
MAYKTQVHVSQIIVIRFRRNIASAIRRFPEREALRGRVLGFKMSKIDREIYPIR